MNRLDLKIFKNMLNIAKKTSLTEGDNTGLLCRQI